MFQLNEEFLKELGLDQLPEEQRKPFLQHIYSELEMRVGERLSQGMSDAQLDEFADIIDKKPNAVDNFLAKYAPNYQQDKMFQRLVQATKADPNDPRLKDEFAATKWLDELKKEIIAHRDAILGGAGASSAPQQTKGDFDLAA